MKFKFLKMLDKENTEQSEDITDEKIIEIVSNVVGSVLEPIEEVLQGFDTRITSMESSVKTIQEGLNDKAEVKSEDEETEEEKEKTKNEDEEEKEKTEQSAMESRIASKILKGLGIEKQTTEQSEQNIITNVLANLKNATDGKQLSEQSADAKDFVTDENGIVYQNVE